MQRLWNLIKKVKHKMVAVCAEKAHSTITGTALSIPKLSTGCKPAVTSHSMPQLPYPSKKREAGTH